MTWYALIGSNLKLKVNYHSDDNNLYINRLYYYSELGTSEKIISRWHTNPIVLLWTQKPADYYTSIHLVIQFNSEIPVTNTFIRLQCTLFLRCPFSKRKSISLSNVETTGSIDINQNLAGSTAHAGQNFSLLDTRQLKSQQSTISISDHLPRLSIMVWSLI